MIDLTLANLDVAIIHQHLRQHIHSLSEKIGVRSIYTYDKLCQAEHYIHGIFEKLGYNVERQTFHFLGHEVANLIAHTSSPFTAQEQYILCAHYDTAPGTPGADDNASAVAILLEVARLARELHLNSNEKVNWSFVAFTTEEPPAFHSRHQGSRVFARHVKKQKQRIDGVINLEMLGYFLDSPNSQQLPLPLHFFGYPSIGNFVGVVGNWRSRHLTRQLAASMRKNPALPVEYAIVPERGFLLFAVRLSDHSSFWDHGYPAVMVTDTAFFRNPYYHTMEDTMEKLNFSAMAEVVRSLVVFLSEVGEFPQ
ncbi:MAG: M28 family peptidase [candidate division KSB1 bacterium]|nr:M28 family peptidase [candidate division KSB1 bacterium]MDZ7304492.1 M28 family peptidase [candidate division KSB1 bacterium]MDZ7312999.1 M28 family peptidase [candidate division KSB1 bacterium]